MKVVHEVRLYVVKETPDPTMTVTQLKRWVDNQFRGCDYGEAFVREITTTVDGREHENKTFAVPQGTLLDKKA